MAETDISQNAAFMDLYSRQIGAYGIETMSKLINMKVLIVGLKGLGVEAAKNIVLAGPGSVTLCDDEPTEIRYFLVAVIPIVCDVACSIGIWVGIFSSRRPAWDSRAPRSAPPSCRS